MEQTLFEFLLEIPKVISLFATWLVSPINERYLNISPLGLLSVGGFALLTGLIITHVIKLFL